MPTPNWANRTITMIELYFSLICLAVLVELGIFARHIIDSGIKVRRAYRLAERAEGAAARPIAHGRLAGVQTSVLRVTTRCGKSQSCFTAWR